MGQTHAHPPFVAPDIVNPVRTDLAKLLVREIVHVYLARLYERKHAALAALKKSLLHRAFPGEL